jgi:UDP-GlcNAc:undecaprenyl-phosphate GlcNAc-1-phosphate transferase
MTMTYTTKLLDGMDGLVTGISTIAALVIFGLSLTPQVMQEQTAMLAITLAGSLLGFLILNFYPAKIFLGESGSTFTGFMLAVLAIVSGGKMAITLLVMGIPLLDMIWVIYKRIRSGRSPFSGDREHLHFKLLEVGLSQPQAVIFLYALSAIFGIAGLFLQSRGKLIALSILVIVMLAILSAVVAIYKRRGRKYE